MRKVFFVSDKYFLFELLLVEFSRFLGSNSSEISIFGALFGPHEVLEMNLAPFLDQLSTMDPNKFKLSFFNQRLTFVGFCLQVSKHF